MFLITPGLLQVADLTQFLIEHWEILGDNIPNLLDIDEGMFNFFSCNVQNGPLSILVQQHSNFSKIASPEELQLQTQMGLLLYMLSVVNYNLLRVI